MEVETQILNTDVLTVICWTNTTEHLLCADHLLCATYTALGPGLEGVVDKDECILSLPPRDLMFDHSALVTTLVMASLVASLFYRWGD